MRESSKGKKRGGRNAPIGEKERKESCMAEKEETKKENKLLALFLTFLKIGAFTFGGGYAMIPLIQREIVEKKKWITNDDILEVVAIAESTPGPIAVNSATFVGYRVAGTLGAFCATVGVVIPSFVVILAISYVLEQFENLAAVQYAFYGIRAGVLALILKALVTMYQECKKNIVAYLLMAAAFVCVAFFDVDVLIVIVGCALFGLLATYLAKRRAEE